MKKFKLFITLQTAIGVSKEAEYELEATSPEHAKEILIAALKDTYNETVLTCRVGEIPDESE